MIDPDELLSPREIAKLLKVKVDTLARWVRDGAFPKPFVAHGREKRWRGKDYLYWVDQKSRIPADDI